MKGEDVKDYCLSRLEATEDFPFGPETAVFRVRNKIFALLFGGENASVNLKCEPNQAQALRDIFPAVKAGYHMNKKHWNTVVLDGSVPSGEIQRMIDHSYDMVVATMPKSQRPAGGKNLLI